MSERLRNYRRLIERRAARPQAMEYRLLGHRDMLSAQDAYNRWGEEGWRIVGFSSDGVGAGVVLQRPRQES